MAQRTDVVGTGRSPWVAPRVEGLPRLTELTLTTGGGIPGGGGTGGSGSTVIP
jgi:hypothetical protein